MIVNGFTGLPDEARLYIFGAAQPLDAAESERLLAGIDSFIAEWQAHKADVAAAREWRHDMFLLLGVDEAVTSLSGCSIDALTRRVRELEQETGIPLINRDRVHYRRGNMIVSATRLDFARAMQAGEIGPGTIVFDNTITTLGQLRAGLWEVPLETSWHARLAPTPARIAE